MNAVQTKSIVEGKSCARAAVAIALRAKRNSDNEGVRVIDMSKAKSSAAKTRPDRYGDALQISLRLEIDLADSTKAISFKGFDDAFGMDGCRSGRTCLITSVTKLRSDAEFTLGITTASRLGAFSYSPLSTSKLVMMNSIASVPLP